VKATRAAVVELLVDRRDQKPVPHEVLKIGELFGKSRNGHLSKGMAGAIMGEDLSVTAMNDKSF
jgi:hypothetical protein